MEFLIAKSGGFCRGVKKAVDTALSIEPTGTYIYGEIIHNPVVVSKITARGIITVDKLSNVPENATLIIRSHGVGEAVYQECEKRNIKVVDCTCEFVRRTQKIIREQYKQYCHKRSAQFCFLCDRMNEWFQQTSNRKCDHKR